MPTPMAVPRRRRAWLTVGLSALTGLLLVGVIGLFGGWETASSQREEALPAISPGERVRVEPFDLTPVKAVHATQLDPILYAEDGVRWLILLMEVTNTAGFPVGNGTLQSTATLDVAGLLPSPYIELPLAAADRVVSESVFRVVDSLPQRTVQPGLAQRLAFVWRQDSREPPPESLTFTLQRHTYRTSNLEPAYDWFDPKPVATVTLPVEELDEP